MIASSMDFESISGFESCKFPTAEEIYLLLFIFLNTFTKTFNLKRTALNHITAQELLQFSLTSFKLCIYL